MPPVTTPEPTPAATAVTADTVPISRTLAFSSLVLVAACLLSAPFALDLLPPEAAALVVPIAQFTPLLAALLVRRRPGRLRADLGLLVPSGRALVLGMLLAIAVFTVVPVLRVLASVALGSAAWSAPEEAAAILVALPLVAVLQTVLAFGEETGWRGWLHGALSPYGILVTALVTAVLWALWHLPIVLALGMGPTDSIAYLGTIAAVSPLLTVLRELSGNIWPALLAHGLLNSLRVAIEQNLTTPLSGGPERWILEAASWSMWVAAAALVLWLAGRRSFVRA